jgi:hypothetical protein
MLQDFLRKYFAKPFNTMATWIGKQRWKQTHPITLEDKSKLMGLLAHDYYIIATRRSNHLSTYGISLANFLLTGKFSFYSHVLVNLEDEVTQPSDFLFVEALSGGTQISKWEDIFGDDTGENSPDAVAILKPRSMSLDHWTAILDKARTQIGKPYDTLFDLGDDKKVSCVELIRIILMEEPNYAVDFADFEKMIKKRKNLTPQMFVDCADFEKVLVIKR